MANTAKFSVFYKARVVKTIVGSTRKLYAFAVTSTGQTPAVPTTATISNTTRHDTTLFNVVGAGVDINFANLPTIPSGVIVEVKNSAASAQLTIPANTWVHYIGLGSGGELYAYVALTNPDTNYHYEEQGTLTVPSGGYTVRHN